MLRTMIALFVTTTVACAPAEPPPEPVTGPPAPQEPTTKKEGIGLTEKPPTPTGPHVMTRGGSRPIAGQAELLAYCLKQTPTTGEVSLTITTTSGKVSAAKLVDRGTADEAFATCLSTKIIGMPFAKDGETPLVLTAM